MNTRLAELSRSIDAAQLGLRIRSARIAARLTQSELGRGEVTSAYISRIEDGQRRPSFSLLGHFAETLGTTLEELLEPVTHDKRRDLELALAQAELTLAGGDPAAALRGADAFLADVQQKDSPDLHRRAVLLRAHALEAAGDLATAAGVLEGIKATPERTTTWVNAMIALTRVYRDAGELGQALAVGAEAEKVIDELGLVGLTESVELSVTLADVHTLKGDVDQALRICRTALDAAQAFDNPQAKASTYWKSSLIEARHGAQVAALDLARNALTYFEIGEDARNVARLRGQVADMRLRLDPPDALGAIETLDPAEGDLAWSPAGALDRAGHLQTRGRAYLLVGRHEEALADALASLELAPKSVNAAHAAGQTLRGEIALATGDLTTAREAFHLAVDALTGVDDDRDAAQLWFELGNLLKEVGQADAALEAFQRAAASTGLRRSAPVPRLKAPKG